MRLKRFILRPLIFIHRWVGIALCLVFLLWFPSGIGMMYWTFPEVSARDELDHSPKLDPFRIVLSPEEAAERIGVQANPAQIRLNSFDGRPAYRFTGGGRGGRGGGGRIVFADNGEEQTSVNDETLDRIAAAWAGNRADEAEKLSVEDVDQWTVAGQLRNLRPMYKYTWPDGQQVYVNGTTGEVVQYTTFWSRIAAHISAIPHWVYYTPLRQNQPVWINFMIYGSLIGTIGAIIGMIVAVWMYSPKRKYRLAGQATGIPYRGQKRWHWMIGMVFGLATITWTFSGLLSLGPFPLVDRLTGQGLRGQQQQAQQTTTQAEPQAGESSTATGQRRGQGGSRGGRGGNRGNAPSGAVATPEAAASERPPAGGGRGSGQQGIAGALRGRVRMADFASVHPRDLVSMHPDLDIRELEWTSFAGTPIFSANLPDGRNQLLSLNGDRIDGFDTEKVIDIVRGAVPDAAHIETRIIDQYDLYYFDRTRQRPLPVILVLMNDADQTRYYVDPRSARVLTTYSHRNWVNRWLYTGLHSLNFPFLYNYRPLWDIVVITFMIGGTALCVTSLVLSWRVLGRKLKRAAGPPNDVLTPEGPAT